MPRFQNHGRLERYFAQNPKGTFDEVVAYFYHEKGHPAYLSECLAFSAALEYVQKKSHESISDEES